MKTKHLIILCAVFLLIAFVVIRSPNRSYRHTDLVTQGVRMSDGSIAIFSANTYGDQWGESFADIIILDSERNLLSRYAFPSNLLENTDVILEVARSRDVIQIRLPGQDAGVRWNVSNKVFDTTNAVLNPSYISWMEMRGIKWN